MNFRGIFLITVGLLGFILVLILYFKAQSKPIRVDLKQYYTVRTLIYADSSITISERGKLMHVNYTYEIK